MPGAQGVFSDRESCRRVDPGVGRQVDGLWPLLLGRGGSRWSKAGAWLSVSSEAMKGGRGIKLGA